MVLFFDNGNAFATGATRYQYRPATENESTNRIFLQVDVQATVFVPDREELWGNFPYFIGLGGFLERIRFAFDPASDTFYFGSLT
ncbi:MAG TPA: hypothetical protein DCY88_12800 [Cyanobacteria bacterium UBA11372]|nr:hypothetical protein [Cyanobacteria bacterium UBA11372]